MASRQNWQEHEARKARKNVLKSRQEELEGELVELAAGELPLAMVADLRRSVAEQDGRERQATESLVVERLLEERDRSLLAVMEEQKVQAKALKLVRELMEADRRQRAAATDIDAERRLAISEQAHALLVDLESHTLPRRLENARRLLEQLRQVQHELEEIERSLAATPAEERVRGVATEFKQTAKRAMLLVEEARRQDVRIATAKSVRQELLDRQHKLLRKRVQQEIREEETVRMVNLAVRTKTTMQEFLRRATAAKIDRLSRMVTESFRFLLRKQTLVEQIMIDPQTFAITLFSRDGQAVSKGGLSEGEKQIFAISVLWGLARASARSLPAIIDTPMARLDARHRQHLVSLAPITSITTRPNARQSPRKDTSGRKNKSKCKLQKSKCKMRSGQWIVASGW